MRVRRALAVAAVVAAAAAGLSGCTSSPEAGTVTVAVSQPFTSANPATAYGSTTTNGDVAAITRSGFGYYDNAYRLVRDESFGTARVLSRDPFTVRYTVKDGITWSDGVALDARDLLLSWAGLSGAVNAEGFDPSRYVDSSSGRYRSDFPSDVVWFDGSDAGLRLSSRMPVLRDGGRSLDVTYAAAFPDWPIAVEPTLPAHVAGTVLGSAGADDDARASAVADAIRGRSSDLTRISRWWNDASNLTGMPKDRGVLASSGPYRVTAISRSSITVSANPAYRGNRTPVYRRIVLKVIPDAQEQVTRLRNGDVDIVSPVPAADVVAALVDVADARTTVGAQGLFEHLDFRIRDSRSGAFADPLVRRAFLHVVPRTQIVQQVVAPVYADSRPLRSFTLPPGDEEYARAARTNGSKAYADVDADAARSLLAEAGVTSPEVCILYDPGNPQRQTEFSLIQQSAATAGFRVTDCSSPDWRQLLGAPGAYDASLVAWDSAQLGTATIGRIYRSDAALTNVTGYSNAEVDALVDRLATADQKTQRSILVSMDKLLWGDAYGAPLFQSPAVSSVNRRVRGVSLSPLQRGVFWNAWQWHPASG